MSKSIYQKLKTNIEQKLKNLEDLSELETAFNKNYGLNQVDTYSVDGWDCLINEKENEMVNQGWVRMVGKIDHKNETIEIYEMIYQNGENFEGIRKLDIEKILQDEKILNAFHNENFQELEKYKEDRIKTGAVDELRILDISYHEELNTIDSIILKDKTWKDESIDEPRLYHIETTESEYLLKIDKFEAEVIKDGELSETSINVFGEFSEVKENLDNDEILDIRQIKIESSKGYEYLNSFNLIKDFEELIQNDSLEKNNGNIETIINKAVDEVKENDNSKSMEHESFEI